MPWDMGRGVVWSNGLILVAAAAAAPHPVWVLYVLCGLVSFLYHCHCENSFGGLDQIVSTTVVVVNVYLAATMYSDHPLWTSAALLCGLSSIILYSVAINEDKHTKHYAKWHTLWHLGGGLTSALLWAPRLLDDREGGARESKVNKK